jgi:hypothetical protein
MAKKSMVGDQTFSSWVRRFILLNPEAGLDKLLEAYDKSGRPKSERPKTMSTIYGQRAELCKRLGVRKFEDIPRLTNGNPNVTQLIGLYLKKRRNAKPEECISFFTELGLKTNKSQFYNERKRLLQDGDSPDSNQASGPRAGDPGVTKRPGLGRKAMPQMLNADALWTAKKLIEEAGSLDSAKVILNFIGQLTPVA